ncbi:hypothetical protein L1987_23600 [Smallanthus sonchifolius]|uniref:Uncharacterized protein n=1 Tax=Smallanthus sonchifolius TaxID=185202 RepID=A0ACB9IHW9_9ASTR|nr:hypothetical protein L1987_23600 [Smallanthus sonchifolius]
MKLSGVTLFLVVLFTLVLNSSQARILQSSPSPQINDPPELTGPINGGVDPDPKGGWGSCWKCWQSYGNRRL